MSTPAQPVPANACDTHVHVFGDPKIYPFDPARHYTPGLATRKDLQAVMRRLGLARAVLVQPSAYGTDNRCLLNALQKMGVSARGIAVVAEGTSINQLMVLHAAGVRGIRINAPRALPEELGARLSAMRVCLGTIADLGWHVQIYGRPQHFDLLQRFLANTDLPFVFDHCGGLPDAGEGVGARIEALRRLIGTGRGYVKLSGAYRIGDFGEPENFRQLIAGLIGENPDGLIWGSDWPHTAAHGYEPFKNNHVPPFRQIDTGATIDQFADAIGSVDVLDRVMRKNPAMLYGWVD